MCRPTVGILSADRIPTVYRQLTDSKPTLEKKGSVMISLSIDPTILLESVAFSPKNWVGIGQFNWECSNDLNSLFLENVSFKVAEHSFVARGQW